MVIKHTFKVAALTLALALAGCAGTKMPKNNTIPEKGVLTDKMKEGWAKETPALKTVALDHDFMIESPQAIPKAIAEKKVEVMFSKESTLDDLGGVLADQGFFLVVPDEALRSKKIVIFNYKGAFGDFLNAISIAHGLSFSWLPGNILMVTESKPYIVQIPQNDTVAKAIEENITSLGATDVKTSVQAGTIQYRANQQNQYRIENMVKKMGINASLVSMQVAVINVSIDSERNTGFDWSSLKAGIGALGLASTDSTTGTGTGTGTSTSSNNSSSNSNSNSSSGTDTGTGTDDTTVKGRTKGVFAGLSSKGLELNIAAGDFSFLSAFNLLSTYGETKTTQSVSMDTISGEEVAIKSGQKIPYIDSIGVNSNNNNGYNNSSNSLGSTDVKDVDIGLELKLKPYYDNRSKLVSIGVDLKLSSLLRFVELSAGNQIGTLTRPQTQEQSFTDNVKVRAGESMIIGGLMYDQLSDNRSNLAMLDDYKTASKSAKVTRTAMFILIRPTVTVFAGKGQAHE
ncbi:type II secretion system protein GspD [Pseudomonas amygdali]|uniref:Type II/III secretion system secretin-like domain-containing protein n=2 Tax=Pseudomonas amygdali pv. lachrymans TaxID=53707 RepID=A0AAD0PU85_PSEAV|nr:hypothetical protein [Pseudomonas amygdali]AXH59395.1 hypothetical protein PLA107_029660 [Pseudomonas amygdali pv. lachrymans str. M301315]RMT05837.1 hypothetical protein ALP54_03332 [Pseudomonas amygdali pv. lachrymans]